MQKLLTILITISFFSTAIYAADQTAQKSKNFTGKITGNKVRMRSSPDLDGDIVKQLNKNDLVLVTNDMGDFWAVKPPSNIKAYVSRKFVLDNIIEGERVNVRLKPSLDSKIVLQLKNKQRVDGSIYEQDPKWFEISLPQEAEFFIAKEYVTYAGNTEYYAIMQERVDEVEKLLNSAYFITQAECKKPYDEMNPEDAINQFDQIIKNYSDFPQHVQQAKEGLALLQDNYLQKKIAYLESKSEAASISAQPAIVADKEVAQTKTTASQNVTDKMKFWKSVEDSLYSAWTTFHPDKKVKDFYKEQEINSYTIAGVLESYSQTIKNKPGDFIVKSDDNSKAYLYSTKLNLDEYVGKKVKLKVSPRPNNNFAYPAFFVNSVEVQ